LDREFIQVDVDDIEWPRRACVKVERDPVYGVWIRRPIVYGFRDMIPNSGDWRDHRDGSRPIDRIDPEVIMAPACGGQLVDVVIETDRFIAQIGRRGRVEVVGDHRAPLSSHVCYGHMQAVGSRITVGGIDIQRRRIPAIEKRIAPIRGHRRTALKTFRREGIDRGG